MKEKIFHADDASLDSVLGFVEEELEAADCPMKTVMQITVCVEEIFVNIAHYSYAGVDGGGDMKLSMSTDGGNAVITFEDSGIPFDPLAKSDPDITLPAEERNIGGLGIFMVKKSMDSVSYEYKDGKNIFTMSKQF